MAILDRAELAFPKSLPEFQRLFPDDAAGACCLEKAGAATTMSRRLRRRGASS